VVSEQRADVVLFTFDPVYERIEKLDKIADDLVNQLVPDNELVIAIIV
jgi:tetrahydromethanopterin S-methyltransferase subunit B